MGTGFFRFRHDGWVDLFVASGHVYPQMDSLDSGPRYREPLMLHMNNHDGTFTDSAAAAGSMRFRLLRDAARRSRRQ